MLKAKQAPSPVFRGEYVIEGVTYRYALYCPPGQHPYGHVTEPPSTVAPYGGTWGLSGSSARATLNAMKRSAVQFVRELTAHRQGAQT